MFVSVWGGSNTVTHFTHMHNVSLAGTIGNFLGRYIVPEIIATQYVMHVGKGCHLFRHHAD